MVLIRFKVAHNVWIDMAVQRLAALGRPLSSFFPLSLSFMPRGLLVLQAFRGGGDRLLSGLMLLVCFHYEVELLRASRGTLSQFQLLDAVIKICLPESSLYYLLLLTLFINS